MKIAQVTPVYPPYHGGIGVIAFEYATRLRALGHRVEVFQPSLRFGNAGFLKGLHRLKECDIVHLHYPFYGGAEQIFMRSLFKAVPFVVTYHMDATASGLKGKIFHWHRKLLQPFILRRARTILVSSPDYADHSALATFSDRKKIIEMPFGIDVTRFHPVATPAEDALRQRLGIPSDAPVLLFVGGMDEPHRFKGVPVLLEALKHRSSPFHLVVVGDGDLRPDFEVEARKLTFREHIHFVGSVPHEELPIYYRMADIHLFPSTSAAEAFGIVALEAAASGIPTIASDLPGVRTVVKHEQTGLLVPPKDASALAEAIERLLNDEPLREKLGAAARKRVVEAYNWETLMRKLLEIYENCDRH